MDSEVKRYMLNPRAITKKIILKISTYGENH